MVVGGVVQRAGPCPLTLNVTGSAASRSMRRGYAPARSTPWLRAAAGQRLTITRSGRPVAELRPLPPQTLDASTLLKRWRHLPVVGPGRLRSDIDDVMDPSL